MKTLIFFFIVALVAMGQLNNTLVIPSLPEMVDAFSTSDGLIKFSVTISLVAFGIAQFIYGPLSDKYGRKKVAVVGLSIFAAGSLVCCLTPTVSLLIVGRFIQGAGVGCVGPISRAISRDTFSGPQFLKSLGYLSMAMAITPAISPALGGVLQQHFGWRASFWLLLALGLSTLLLLIARLPETNESKLAGRLSVTYLYKSYLELCTHPRFIGLLLCNMLVYAGEIGFLVSASFIMQTQGGVNPATFGSISLLIVPCMLAGSLTLSRLSCRYDARTTAIIGIVFVLIGAASMWVLGLTCDLSLASVGGPMMIYAFGQGILVPSTSAGSMSLFPHKAGFAGSLSGGLAMIGAGLVNVLMECLQLRSQLALGGFLITVGFAIIAVFYLLVWRGWQGSPTNREPLCRES